MMTLLFALTNYLAASLLNRIGSFAGFKANWGFNALQIGQVSEVLVAQGAQLIIPVALLHAAAFALGYFLSKLCSFGETTSRTISIECGMQASFTCWRTLKPLWKRNYSKISSWGVIKREWNLGEVCETTAYYRTKKLEPSWICLRKLKNLRIRPWIPTVRVQANRDLCGYLTLVVGNCCRVRLLDFCWPKSTSVTLWSQYHLLSVSSAWP